MKTTYLSFLLAIFLVMTVGIKTNGHTLSGLVFNVKENNPQANHPVYFVTQKMEDTLVTYSDNEGYFSIDIQIDFADSGYVQVLTVDPCSGDTQRYFIYPFTSSNFVEFKVCSDTTSTPNCEAWFDYYTGGWVDSVYNNEDNLGNPNSEIYFYDLSVGDITSWYWDFGDGSSSSEQNPIHVYDNSSEYLVTLTVMSNDCKSSIQNWVWINNIETECTAWFYYDYGYDSDSSTISNGEVSNDLRTIYFHDYSTGAPTSWKWDFGDGETSTEQNPWHYFANDGEYLVTLEIGGESCFSSYSQYIYAGNVNTDTIWIPENCQSYFYPIFEKNLSVSLINQSYGEIVSNFWDFGDDVSSSEVNPVHQYSKPGDYLVSLTINTFDNCVSTFEMYVTVNDNSYQNDSILTALFIPEINGNSVTCHDISVGQVNNRYWDFGDGESSTNKEPIHIYNELKTYYVTLGISNPYAVRTYTMELNLSDATFKGYFGNEDATSVGSNSRLSFVDIYPNPVIDKLAIGFNSNRSGNAEISLFNLAGQVVANKNFEVITGFNSMELSTGLLDKGLYLLQIKRNHQLLVTKKVAKY